MAKYTVNDNTRGRRPRTGPRDGSGPLGGTSACPKTKKKK